MRLFAGPLLQLLNKASMASSKMIFIFLLVTYNF